MSEPVLNLWINILLMVLAIVSVIDAVYDNKPHKVFFKRFKPRGGLLIISAFLVVWINFTKDNKHEIQVAKDQKALKEGTDKTKKEIVDAVSENARKTNVALAEYNLSVQKTSDSLLTIVKDTSKRRNTYITPEVDPYVELYVPTKGQKGDAIRIKSITPTLDSLYTDFYCVNNSAFHVSAYTLLILIRPGDTSLIRSISLNDISMRSLEGNTAGLGIAEDLQSFSEIYLRILISFRNSKGKPLYYEELFRYDMKTGDYLTVTGLKIIIDPYLTNKDKIVKRFFKDHLILF